MNQADARSKYNHLSTYISFSVFRSWLRVFSGLLVPRLVLLVQKAAFAWKVKISFFLNCSQSLNCNEISVTWTTTAKITADYCSRHAKLRPFRGSTKAAVSFSKTAGSEKRSSLLTGWAKSISGRIAQLILRTGWVYETNILTQCSNLRNRSLNRCSHPDCFGLIPDLKVILVVRN